MRSPLALLLVALMSCGRSAETPRVSKEPVSVRGWIADVDGASSDAFRTSETDYARKIALFKQTHVWVEGAPYVSGTIAENGSFILLDVPPGNPIITFSAPGAPDAKLVLKDVPGSADVLVPALLLGKESARPLDSRLIRVRMAAKVSKPTPTTIDVFVAGHRVRVVNAPYAAMVDRRDFPNPPGSEQPLATVK